MFSPVVGVGVKLRRRLSRRYAIPENCRRSFHKGHLWVSLIVDKIALASCFLLCMSRIIARCSSAERVVFASFAIHLQKLVALDAHFFA
jgi:hypothetical protein